jgi:hypothetical protein
MTLYIGCVIVTEVCGESDVSSVSSTVFVKMCECHISVVGEMKKSADTLIRKMDTNFYIDRLLILIY